MRDRPRDHRLVAGTHQPHGTSDSICHTVRSSTLVGSLTSKVAGAREVLRSPIGVYLPILRR
jgi:hypothetical protein